MGKKLPWLLPIVIAVPVNIVIRSLKRIKISGKMYGSHILNRALFSMLLNHHVDSGWIFIFLVGACFGLLVPVECLYNF